MAREGGGRRRIEIREIEERNKVHTTFTKRKDGVLKKACEISALCRAQVAFVAFSPGEKAFGFGQPSIEAVMSRFLAGNPEVSQQMDQPHRNAELADQITEAMEKLNNEMQREREIENIMRERTASNSWKNPERQLDLPQLEHLKRMLEGRKAQLLSGEEKVESGAGESSSGGAGSGRGSIL